MKVQIPLWTIRTRRFIGIGAGLCSSDSSMDDKTSLLSGQSVYLSLSSDSSMDDKDEICEPSIKESIRVQILYGR